METSNEYRQIVPTWNAGLITASVAVSLLGAFTSTQLMCQARVSRALLAIVVWTMLASLTFGFCSIWSLHFVAMLACELDVAVGLNPGLTILSAFLAVIFTFVALSSDMIWERYRKHKARKSRATKRESGKNTPRIRSATPRGRQSTEMLLGGHDETDFAHRQTSPDEPESVYNNMTSNGHIAEFERNSAPPYTDAPEMRPEVAQALTLPLQRTDSTDAFGRFSIDSDREETDSALASNASDSRRGSGTSDSETTFSGLGKFVSIRTHRESPFASSNPFKTTAKVLWAGLTQRNISKGFVWSLAITLMHYLGIFSMRIPGGYFRAEPVLVVVSAIISWVVCTVGCILMASMETNLSQQLLFAVVASCGVAAMHYTGMAATTFYTSLPASDVRGYPPGLPIAIASIAIVTCLAANGLLAHSATIARNKLAEIVRTRKKLWAAIAQKENAEAAALARSDFIASASHEIRTPLHQLQGYSDLMARCPLPEDARLLLFAIQDATKTLSLITNNVLDWSRLEKGEASTRPTTLDIRQVCDSIIKLLPRRDDDVDVELIVVVSPTVPKFLYIDETYFHRIAMNLVSNSLKFTTTGYISLLLDRVDGNLIITVRDTGVGIPESFLPHLFEPFKQAQTRGAERGTGLGLSIVKQLVEKIYGEIQVESKHKDVKNVGAENCGSKFVVTIPNHISESSENGPDCQLPNASRQQLAHLELSPSRVSEGLSKAWDKFGVDVVSIKSFDELPTDVKYIWVDIKCLRKDNSLLEKLSDRTNVLVLVSYDTENTLYSVLGLVPPNHFVPIKRPWVFHHVMDAIEHAGRRPERSDLAGRTVRFASDVDIHSIGTSGYESETASVPPSEAASEHESPDLSSNAEKSKPVTILLVEDNKINQKLGAKMLKILGYEVVLADDGQEAIDMMMDDVLARTVDMILMDQSMPRKDGLTATKEIRQLEQEGTIVGSDKWQFSLFRRSRRPIIAVTAVVGPGHESMCKAVGTDAFLPKPLSLQKLREQLEEYTKELSATAQWSE